VERGNRKVPRLGQLYSYPVCVWLHRHLTLLPVVPGQSWTRAAYRLLTSQSPQGCLLSLPPSPLPHLTQGVSLYCTWEVAREGLCTHWLEEDTEAQSEINHVDDMGVRSQRRQAGRKQPPYGLARVRQRTSWCFLAHFPAKALQRVWLG
jgi:hypothetical protein